MATNSKKNGLITQNLWWGVQKYIPAVTTVMLKSCNRWETTYGVMLSQLIKNVWKDLNNYQKQAEKQEKSTVRLNDGRFEKPMPLRPQELTVNGKQSFGIRDN
jgi:hypothetical protein